MRVLLGAITHDPVLCVVIAAALTWAVHSSVAVVLLVMSLAYSHFVTAEAALALVLGANLGSAINPLLEGGTRGDPASRRLPLGNLINRLVGILIALPLLPLIARELTALQPDAAKMTAEFHLSVQRRARGDFHRPARRHGMAARAHPAGAAASPPIHRCRAISTKPRSIRLRWQSPTPHARRCASAIPSRPCCVRS